MNDIGNRLKYALKNGYAAHAYLIVAPDLDRASELARSCAAILLMHTEQTEHLPFCADYFELNGSVKIDELRSIRSEVYVRTFEGKNRVVLIKNAHLMNDNSVNAMLKMLEEPPEGTFFLLTGIEQRILPTIRSRCHIVRLGSDSLSSIETELIARGANEIEAKAFAMQSIQNTKRAIALYEQEAFRELRKSSINAMLAMLDGKMPFKWVKTIGKNREYAVECIEFMFGICHDILRLTNGLAIDINTDFDSELRSFKSMSSQQINGILSSLVEASVRLSTNASPSLTLDALIVSITCCAKQRS